MLNLDFTGLDRLSGSGEAGSGKEKHAKINGEGLFNDDECNCIHESENAVQNRIEARKRKETAPPYIGILQMEADNNKASKERALAICKEYQEAIKRSEELQAGILKGARDGEDPRALLLKAAEAISLMTSNKVFYKQLAETIDKKK